MKMTALAGAGIGLRLFPARPGHAAAKGITIGQGVDLPTLDPYGHSAQFNYAMWRHMNEGLVKYDLVNRRYSGVLAESWKAEETEWTFNLRKGIKFHNGMDLTARDVLFSIERIMKSKQAAILGPTKEVKLVNDYTLKIITNKPFAPLPSSLKDAVIVSQQVYSQDPEKAIRNPVGTGPFKFVEWVRGSHLVVDRNEKYWGKPAQVEQVIWKPIPEDSARITALETGEVDIATNVMPHEADRLEKKPGLRIERVRAMRSIHIGLPLRFKPFQNRLVRIAMNHAVDVDTLIKYVLDGKADRATGISGPNVIGYNSDIKPYSYDPARAKALLSQAGYPNGFDVDLISPSGRYVKDREAAQAIAGQLAKVGVRANVITQEFSVFWSGLMEGKHPMFLFGGFNLEDPEIMLALYFESGITKRLEYNNPQVDKAIKEQRMIFDHEKRDRALKEIIKTIYEDAPTIPLWHPQDLYGVTQRVVWKPSPDEEISAYEASIRG
jgi:peptide/nickel transport system substrate-binding protein